MFGAHKTQTAPEQATRITVGTTSSSSQELLSSGNSGD
jgi:hypothetical protein